MAPVVTFAAVASSATVTSANGRAPNSLTAESASLPFGEVEIGIQSGTMSIMALRSLIIQLRTEGCTMKLEFLFTPTSDLKGSLALYRDGLGFTEAWREGDATVALALPGTDVQLMLDSHDPDAPAGPLFVVDSVEAFHAGRAESLTVVEEPSEIPGGF